MPLQNARSESAHATLNSGYVSRPYCATITSGSVPFRSGFYTKLNKRKPRSGTLHLNHMQIQKCNYVCCGADQHYCKVILSRWCLWSCKVSTIALFMVMFIVSCHPTKTHLWLTLCSCCQSIHQAVHCLHLWLWEWRKDLFCFSCCLPWWLLSTPGLRSLIKKWQLTTVSQIQLQAGHWWEKMIVVPKYSVIWCVVHKAYSAVKYWWVIMMVKLFFLDRYNKLFSLLQVDSRQC